MSGQPAPGVGGQPVPGVGGQPAPGVGGQPVPGVGGQPVPAGALLPDYAGRVLDVADAIPPGRVMSYGDVAEYLGEGGPRQVGRVMSLWGGSAPWWRVVHADGSLLRGHEQAALRAYRAEGTPLREPGRGGLARIDMRRARWDGRW